MQEFWIWDINGWFNFVIRCQVVHFAIKFWQIIFEIDKILLESAEWTYAATWSLSNVNRTLEQTR